MHFLLGSISSRLSWLLLLCVNKFSYISTCFPTLPRNKVNLKLSSHYFHCVSDQKKNFPPHFHSPPPWLLIKERVSPPFPWARGEYGGGKGWRATASSRETEGVKGIKRTDEINKGKSSLVKRASLPIISFPMMCLWYSIRPSPSPAWLWGEASSQDWTQGASH